MKRNFFKPLLFTAAFIGCAFLSPATEVKAGASSNNSGEIDATANLSDYYKCTIYDKITFSDGTTQTFHRQLEDFTGFVPYKPENQIYITNGTNYYFEALEPRQTYTSPKTGKTHSLTSTGQTVFEGTVNKSNISFTFTYTYDGVLEDLPVYDYKYSPDYNRVITLVDFQVKASGSKKGYTLTSKTPLVVSIEEAWSFEGGFGFDVESDLSTTTDDNGYAFLGDIDWPADSIHGFYDAPGLYHVPTGGKILLGNTGTYWEYNRSSYSDKSYYCSYYNLIGSQYSILDADESLQEEFGFKEYNQEMTFDIMDNSKAKIGTVRLYLNKNADYKNKTYLYPSIQYEVLYEAPEWDFTFQYNHGGKKYTADTISIIATQSNNYTGLKNVNGGWYMYENGVITNQYNSLTQYNGSWWYVKNSKVDFSYTGLCKYNGSWWFIKNGKVDFSYTGLCKYNGSWWYIQNGQLNFKYTGLCKYNGSWWYIQNGQLNFKYTGLCKYNGSWWYIQNGQLNFKYTGLCKYNGSWWYIQNGILNFGYTGLCKHGSNWFFIQKGILNWNYTGYTYYGGSRWYVKSGIMKYKA